jgi:hypothetical protein
MSIIWDVRTPTITYPLIRILKPASFKWQALCDGYNVDLPEQEFRLSPLERAEGGFCLSADGFDGDNGAIRQLRKIGNVFTPLYYTGFKPSEMDHLVKVLNGLCGSDAFICEYESCHQCQSRNSPLSYQFLCEECQSDWQERETSAEEQARCEQLTAEDRHDWLYNKDD